MPATNQVIAALKFAKVSPRQVGIEDLIIARGAADKEIKIRIERVGAAPSRLQIRVGVIGDEALSLRILGENRASPGGRAPGFPDCKRVGLRETEPFKSRQCSRKSWRSSARRCRPQKPPIPHPLPAANQLLRPSPSPTPARSAAAVPGRTRVRPMRPAARIHARAAMTAAPGRSMVRVLTATAAVDAAAARVATATVPVTATAAAAPADAAGCIRARAAATRVPVGNASAR